MDCIKKARMQVLETGRDMLKKGLVSATWGNISCRIECNDMIAITPTGMEYDTLVAEDIVILDNRGNVVHGKRRPSTERPLHLHLYNNRRDIGAIVHTHSTYAMAMACVRRPLGSIAEELVQVTGGDVPVAQYALPGSVSLAVNVLRALQDKNAVLLANHGMIGVAKTLKEALKVCEIVEKGAKIAVISRLIGEPVPIAPEDIRAMRRGYATDYGQRET